MEKMKLDPELRSKWLEALRSEDYAGRECYSTLADGQGGYCALGIAANEFDVRTLPQDGDDTAYDWLEEKGVDTPRVWRVFDPGHTMTFPEFADWLEANSEPRE